MQGFTNVLPKASRCINMRNPFLSDWWSGRRRGLKLLRVFKDFRDFKDFKVFKDLRVFRVVEVLGLFLPPGVPSPVGKG